MSDEQAPEATKIIIEENEKNDTVEKNLNE